MRRALAKIACSSASGVAMAHLPGIARLERRHGAGHVIHPPKITVASGGDKHAQRRLWVRPEQQEVEEQEE
jgi:hypothetical protein